jgi:hypothetical protein
MVYVAPIPTTGEGSLQLPVNQRESMGTKPFKVAFLIAAVLFFSVLALDIAVPALVLGIMALSNWLILSFGVEGRNLERGAA